MKSIIIDIFAEKFDNVKVNLKSIDNDVFPAIKEYFESHPKALTREKKESGIDPLSRPLSYFKIELKEPEHKDILALVNKTGILTLEIYKKWQKENSSEKV